MSNLPQVPLPSGTFTEGPLAGVEYHSLSRSQALKLQSFKGKEDAAEDYIVACGTNPLNPTESEQKAAMASAHVWRSSVALGVAGELVDAIIMLSGLSGDSGPKA